MSNTINIVVFGSCFLDYIAYGDRIPNPGETLTSTSFAKGFGGKGANQAVAAARLLGGGTGGGQRLSVSMAGCVGEDGDGNEYIQNLKNAGCDVSKMVKLENQSTGIALITVDKKGRNAIVICPNAAGRTSFGSESGKIFSPKTFFSSSSSRGIFICQNEIPLPATLESLKAAFLTKRFFTVFNPAPAPSTKEQIQQLLPYLKYVSLICPNEHEAFLMTGVKVTDLASASKAIQVLQRDFGALDVIITMGEHGCAVAGRNSGGAQLVRAHRVKAIDTTGAGDCFVGSLSYFLARAMEKRNDPCSNNEEGSSMSFPVEVLADACRKANVIAAHSVTKKGTQSSYHTRDQLPRELFAGEDSQQAVTECKVRRSKL